MPPESSYYTFVLETLDPLGPVTSKYMFGGYALYHNSAVFALVAGNELYLKADDVNRQEFEQAGSRAFQPFPDKPVTMSYYLAPAEVFEHEDGMLRWCNLALEASRRSAQKSKKPRSKPHKRVKATSKQLGTRDGID